jgi:prevent-host-death family protein
MMGVVKTGRIVNVHDAKTNFSRLLERVATGEDILIARAGTPVARLTRYEKDGRRALGLDVGRGSISPDFDAAVPDDFADGFAGR